MQTQKLRLCYVADLRSLHARRWVDYFAGRGHSVVALSPPVPPGPPVPTGAPVRPNDPASPGPGVPRGLASEPAAPETLAGETSSATGSKERAHIDVRPLLRRPGLPKFIQLANVLPLLRVLRTFRPHVLHAHYVRIYGWIAALSFFRPLVVTVWGGDILEDQGAFSDFFGRKLSPFALKRADLVTAHSRFLKNRVVELGKPESQVAMVGCPGIDRKVFRPGLDATSLRRDLGLGVGPVVRCPRIMDRIYNTETVLRAIPLVLKEIPEAKFVFSEYMGNRVYIEEMKALAGELNVRDSVVFLKDFPYDRMPLLLNASDVLVSIPDSDGMPVSLLEGMSCGTVPVVSDLPQYAGLVEKDVNALVLSSKEPAELAGALVKLLSDSSLRKRLSAACVNTTAECVDYETEMEKMEKLYYELAGARARGRPE